MERKSYKPEEVVSKLRQVDVLHSQGMSMSNAVREVGVVQSASYIFAPHAGRVSAGYSSRNARSKWSDSGFNR